jgi:hypothetical protein
MQSIFDGVCSFSPEIEGEQAAIEVPAEAVAV